MMESAPQWQYEPIAIIGTGCRFPMGVNSSEDLWRFLENGSDAVCKVPADRWDVDKIYEQNAEKSGTTYCREGAFLDNIAGFDATFFGITQSEAREMDPQQRLVLEVAFESVHNAGLQLSRLKDSRTGVFVGMLGMDYLALHAREAGVEAINPYYATGKEFSFGAGRIAYHLGVRGPALTVSTACSSSLVAVHLATRALATGDADMALAGGVNLMCTPDLTIFMSQVRAISPTGRCRVFDAAADGIVRGEGCGMVMLKRLCDAQRDGDNVRAVIRGSAINHDGASAGMTVPNPQSQIEVMQLALAAAGLQAEQVNYLEAHGTGTPLGDPIELDSIARVYGDRRRKIPLSIGSMKANFGHMDAAAGVGSLLKLVEVVGRGRIPPQINVENLTRAIDWDGAGLTVATEPTNFPQVEKRIAGISAFGLSGTNVHLLLDAPKSDFGNDPIQLSYPLVFPVSARTHAALRVSARNFANRLQQADDAAVGDLVAAAWHQCDHHTRRAAIVAEDCGDLIAKLDLLDAEEATDTPDISCGVLREEEPSDPVFIYTGQGSQWAQMGVDLLETDVVFRETLRACDDAIAEFSPWSIEFELRRAPEESRLHLTEIAQPVITAIQIALTERWRAWGLRPCAVIGHSMGEVAAAHGAGVLDLAQAMRVIWHRGDVMSPARGGGKMLAVGAGAEALRSRIATCASVDIAAINSPQSCVLAGDRTALETLAEQLRKDEVFALFLPGEYAFHSNQMTPFTETLFERLGALDVQPAQIPWIATSGPVTDYPTGDAAYWVRNIRQTVNFAAAIERLGTRRLFLEIGPHSVLATPLRQCLAMRDREVVVARALLRGQSGATTLCRALAQLHVGGARLDTAAIQRPGRRVVLPAYPWQRRDYWFEKREDALPQVDVSELSEDVRINDRKGRLLARTDGLNLESDTHVDTAIASPARVERCVQATPEFSTAKVLERLIAEVHALLGLPEDEQFDVHLGFFDLGFDSVALLELRRKLQVIFEVTLPSTVGFDYPSCVKLAGFISTKLAQTRRRADVPTSTVPTAPSAQGDPIAVIGIGCAFPGAADTNAFWRSLIEGHCAVADFPSDRWPTALYPQAGQGGYPARAAFLDNIAGFDAEFFQISPREARQLDPQQRLVLMTAWEALERAGINPVTLRETRTGVYLGVNSHDYDLRIAADPARIDAYWGTGNSFSAVSGRLSHFLGLQGPSIAVDTACSSSLSAVHLAAQAMRAGECDMALVGGVNLIASPAIFLSMGAAGALAPDGRCKTFDASADGYGRGEGCGIVVLKRLSQARADGDRVIVTLAGSAINHDGPSGGLTVPNGPAQQALIRAALIDAGLPPAAVSYVEAHGTGTSLGDPIELQALDAVYREGRAAPLQVGSVKTNIGHLEAAAGIASLIKVALAIQEGMIPAHLHFGRPNDRLNWGDLMLSVPVETVKWNEPPVERVAGISAFGFTGTNAHILLRGVEPTLSPIISGEAARCLPLVLSAKSETALSELARRTAQWLRATKPDIEKVCHSAAVRRAALANRLVVFGDTVSEFADALEAAAVSMPPPPCVGTPTPEATKLVERWLKGECVDWSAIWSGAAPVVDLPTYPWQLESFWFDSTTSIAAEVQTIRPGPILLGPNEWLLPEEQAVSTSALIAAAMGCAEAALIDLTFAARPVTSSVRLQKHAGRIIARDRLGEIMSADIAPMRATLHSPVLPDIFEARLIKNSRRDVALAELAAQMIRSGQEDGSEIMEVRTGLCGQNAATVRYQIVRAALALLAPDAQVAGLGVVAMLADLPAEIRLELSAESLNLYTLNGALLGQIGGVSLKQTSVSIPVVRPALAHGYVLNWEPFELPRSDQGSGHWVVIGALPELAEPLSAALAERGMGVEMSALDPADPAAMSALFAQEVAHPDCRGILFAGALSSSRLPTVGAQLLALAQAAATAKWIKPVWFLAPPVDGVATVPSSAAIWGGARSFGLEYPGFWGGLVALDPSDARDFLALADLLATAPGEDHVSLRAGRAWVARLGTMVDLPETMTPPDLAGGCAILHAPAPELVAPLGDWLKAKGTALIALIGHAPPDFAGPVYDGDPSDSVTLNGWLDMLRAQARIVAVMDVSSDWVLTPLADTISDAFVREAAQLRSLVALDDATRSDPVQLFASFSNAAVLWGAMGLGASASGAAARTALIAGRRAQGLPGTVLHWTQWEVSVADDAEARQAMGLCGVTPLSNETALAWLDIAVGCGLESLGVAEIDWTQLAPLYRANLGWPVLGTLGQDTRDPADSALRADLEALPVALRADCLSRHLRRLVAEVFGFDSDDRITLLRGFFDMGMTSMMAVDLRNRLERLLAVELPSTLAFEHTSVDAMTKVLIADYLGLGPRAEPQPKETPHRASKRTPQPQFEITDARAMSEADLLAALQHELSDLDMDGD